MAEDLSKLPKWAQIRIELAEASLSDARRELAEMRGQRETNVECGEGFVRGHAVYIGDDEKITFWFDKKRRHYIQVRRRERRAAPGRNSSPGRDGIEVRSSHGTAVRPRAANVAFIEFDPDY